MYVNLFIAVASQPYWHLSYFYFLYFILLFSIRKEFSSSAKQIIKKSERKSFIQTH